MIFIVSTGYSGTKFIAEQFGFAHEPRTRDYNWFWEFMYNQKNSADYLRANLVGSEREVNSNLLPHLKEIESLYPNCNIIHLVRNPKDTIRSLVSGTIFSDKDKRPGSKEITNEDERFKACVDWWAYWHEILDKYPLIRLEDFKGDPVNVKDKRYPAFEGWSDQNKEYFWLRCGNLFDKYYGRANR